MTQMTQMNWGGESRELGWSTKLAVEMGGEKRLQNIRKIN